MVSDWIKECFGKIKTGMISRLLLTTLSFLFLSSYTATPFLQKYLLLILPLALSLLDFVDNIQTHKTKCTQTFEYQYKDKVVDVLSYLFSYALFPLDATVLYLTLFRGLGVLLFIWSRESYWLIAFLDFVKEYMLYTYIFDGHDQYMPLAIGAKFIFELFFHTTWNKNNYRSDV